MGTASSVSKPSCPYERLRLQNRQRAQRGKYKDGMASELYSLCSNGEIDKVCEILRSDERPPIDDLHKLEPNGDTALHAATRNGHRAIVKLLLEQRCDRTIINRDGRIAAEEARDDDMQQLFKRPTDSNRFHDPNISDVTSVFFRENDEGIRNPPSPKAIHDGASTTVDAAQKPAFVRSFKTEKETYEYCLNQQTLAMWMQFYNWFFRKYPTLFQRDFLQADTFDLHKNPDFREFLDRHIPKDKHEQTFNAIRKGKESNSIKPIINIYTSESADLYRSLNRQLSHSAVDPDLSPHLCDRFIIEFYIHRDELETRSCLGTIYRGATCHFSDLSIYEEAFNQGPKSVIAFNAFTSTSKNPDIALAFMFKEPPKADQLYVLLVIEIKEKSPTIVGIADLSEYEKEEEILVLPGNLFTVTEIKKDVIHQYCGTQKTVTEIHLEQHHLSVSFMKKIIHTIRSARKPDV